MTLSSSVTNHFFTNNFIVIIYNRFLMVNQVFLVLFFLVLTFYHLPICKLITISHIVKLLHGLIKSSISPSKKNLWAWSFTARSFNSCFIQMYKKLYVSKGSYSLFSCMYFATCILNCACAIWSPCTPDIAPWLSVIWRRSGKSMRTRVMIS